MKLLETAFGVGSRKVLVTRKEYEGFCQRSRAKMANFADNSWDNSRWFITPSNTLAHYNELHRHSPSNMACCYFVFVASKFWQK